jgi:transcriptional regulator with XRE-family HTH domain
LVTMTSTGEVVDYVVPEFTVADRLRKARQVAGIDQGRMAEILLRTRNTIGNYENGRTLPKWRVLKRWAETCHVSVGWLVTGDAQSPGPDGPGALAMYPPWDSNPEPADFRIGGLSRAVAAAA